MKANKFKSLTVKFLAVFALIVCTTISGYSYDREGLMIGIEANIGLTYLEYESGGVQASEDITKIYGGTVVGEYMFTDFMGFAFGLGIKFYEMDFVRSGTYLHYDHYIMNIPLSLRFRPIPLFAEEFPLTIFVGIGLDIQSSVYAYYEEGSSSGEFKAGFGLILEGGIGFYITDSFLLQGVVKYNYALASISGNENNTMKPSFLEFGISLNFKIF